MYTFKTSSHNFQHEFLLNYSILPANFLNKKNINTQQKNSTKSLFCAKQKRTFSKYSQESSTSSWRFKKKNSLYACTLYTSKAAWPQKCQNYYYFISFYPFIRIFFNTSSKNFNAFHNCFSNLLWFFDILLMRND